MGSNKNSSSNEQPLGDCELGESYQLGENKIISFLLNFAVLQRDDEE